MPGVAFGFLCGAALVSVPTDIFLLSRTLQVSVAELIRPYLPYLWRFAVAGGVALAVRNWLGAPDRAASGDLDLARRRWFICCLCIPYVWTTPLRGYIQGATATLTSAMRTRVLGWSNNGMAFDHLMSGGCTR